MTDPLAQHMTEKDLSDTVAQIAKIHGWIGYHTHDSRRSNPGFPDWCFTRNGRTLFVELKTSKGKATAVQMIWLEALAKTPGVECYLWRPESLRSGEINQALA